MFSYADWPGLVKTHLQTWNGERNFTIGTREESN
jgi:hypothetical protein